MPHTTYTPLLCYPQVLLGKAEIGSNQHGFYLQYSPRMSAVLPYIHQAKVK